MPKDFKVSQSKVKTYRKCRQMYYFKYVEKLRRRRIKRPFKFGGIVHEMMEAHSNGDDAFEILDNISFKDAKLFAKEKEMYGDIVEDIRVIMKAYFDYWPEDSLMPLRKNKRSAEHEFNVEIDDGLIFNGKIDEVARTPNRLRWVVENKTFTNMPNEDHRWKNLQSSVYIRAIEMMGWWDNISGTCWNYVKSKAPNKPELLKSGKMSERNLVTLPSVVRATLREHKLKAKDYPKLIKMAENCEPEYFKRIFTPVNSNVVNRLFSGFVDTAREVRDTHGTKCDKNIDRHCDFCDYEPLCRAELTGSDVDFIKDREYYIDEGKKDDEDEKQREE